MAFTWADCHSIIATLPFDSPLNRIQNEHWYWDDPQYQLLVLIAEATHNRNVLAGTSNPKARKGDLLKIPRPWNQEKTEKKIGQGALPISDLDDWLDQRTKKVS